MGRILTVRPSAAVLRPCGSAPVVWVGWEAVDQNKPACGGAREGGNWAGAAEASLVSRWVRGVVQGCTGYGPKDGIFWITAGSSIQAMIRNAPPQAGQVSMSMPNTRTLTSALLDRLLHHAETVLIEGSSDRMKDRLEGCDLGLIFE